MSSAIVTFPATVPAFEGFANRNGERRHHHLHRPSDSTAYRPAGDDLCYFRV
jgi:hypothetical protein